MRVRRVLLAGWLLLLLIVSVAGTGLPPESGVGLPDDPGPRGTASLERIMGGTSAGQDRLSVSLVPVVHDPDRLLVVAAPERGPLPGEARALDRFMHQGGTAMLFISSDAWNPILSSYGFTLHGALLLGATGDTSRRTIPVQLPQDLGGGRLVLVNGTSILDPEAGVETVVPSDELVLDLDGDGRVSAPPDAAGRFPVVASVAVGEGRLVVVASGEAVLGTHMERNLDAVERLLEAQGAGRGATLDASTHPMGVVDALRGPSRILLSFLHVSWAGAGLAAAVSVVSVIRTPRAGGLDRDATSKLDEQTDATQEWLHRGSP